jgi:hypothetical protein
MDGIMVVETFANLIQVHPAQMILHVMYQLPNFAQMEL